MFRFPNVNLRTEAKILIRASFLAFFALGLFGPLYAIFVQNIGGDILDAGIAFAIFNLVTGVFILTLGTSRFFARNVRPMVVIGYVVLTIGEAGYLLVQNPYHLFIVQVIIGLAGGILEPSWDSIFAAELSEAEASTHWALWAGGQNIVTGIAAAVGGAIVATYSFTALFVVMAVFNLFAVFAVLKILKTRPNRLR